MTSQKLAKEDLSQLLVEKHQNFITGYKREYDILDRLFVLKEKREQLRYWVDESKTNPAQHEKYLLAMKNNEEELSKLSEELKSLKETSHRSFGPSESDPKARHKWLKAQITGHEEGASYWTNKIKEIADAKNRKKEEKGVQASGSEAHKKVRKAVKKPKKGVKAPKAAKKKHPSSN
jgi:hypothetical protein